MLRRLAGYISRDAPVAIGVIVSMLAGAAVEMLMPWPLKVVVDHAIGGQPLLDRVPDGSLRIFLLVASAAALVLLAMLRGSFQFFRERWTAEVSQRASLALRADLYAQLQRVSLRFHDRSRVGDLVTRITRDVDRLQDAFVDAAGLVTADLFVVLGIAVVMLLVDWKLGVVSLLVVPPLFVVYSVFRARLKRAQRIVRSSEGALASLAQEVLSSIRVVRAFGREVDEHARFRKLSASGVEAEIEAATWEGMFSFSVEVVTAAGIAVVVGYGGWRVLSGEITLGALVLFVQYVRALYEPVRRLSRLTTITQRAAASAERLEDVFASESDVPESAHPRRVARARGALSFRKVWFGYDSRPVLCGVDLDIESGEVVGVVGPTGAGKSTLVTLVPRFYDPVRGHILLDGVDLRELRLRDLRAQISMVLQDPFLFAGTIAQNIAYARPDATEAEVVAAARAAHADEFIERLPEGYASRVGERGVNLSGGQRQRLAIARALLRDAPILVLDEPTSAVDEASEMLILEALSTFIRGRTTIVVSHRSALLSLVSRVHALRDGTLHEASNAPDLTGATSAEWRASS